jgi:hypothetical protein
MRSSLRILNLDAGRRRQLEMRPTPHPLSPPTSTAAAKKSKPKMRVSLGVC